MANTWQTGDDEGINAINVVPLVDVMLVLLVIFMVTTQFVEHRSPTIPIDLPAAASGEETKTSLLSLVVNKDGLLFLNNRQIDEDGLKAFIQKTKARDPQKKLQALVYADERLPHGRVVELLDIMRIEGVDDIAVNTKKQEIE